MEVGEREVRLRVPVLQPSEGFGGAGEVAGTDQAAAFAKDPVRFLQAEDGLPDQADESFSWNRCSTAPPDWLPPNTMAPSLPFPRGRASSHWAAGAS